MNLSCGKCKTIQPFSGDPPKCNVCGWVCDSVATKDTAYWQNLRTQRHQPASAQEDGRILQKLFGVAIVIAIIFGAAYWLTPEKQRLAEKYSVSQDRVFIEPKPYGCDYDDAPLGNKHCHFEKNVDVGRACPAPDCRVTSVYVSWRKVDE
ncbi:MAG: hypothetical protein WBL63_14620 [Candidatus Acidiferrum sp.]